MSFCVLKESSLLTLWLETTLPNKSKRSQMAIKLPIGRWIKTDLGTDPPMQTGALAGVVQVFKGHPFEDEVRPTVLFQEHQTNTVQPTASQSTTRKHPKNL